MSGNAFQPSMHGPQQQIISKPFIVLLLVLSRIHLIINFYSSIKSFFMPRDKATLLHKEILLCAVKEETTGPKQCHLMPVHSSN